MKLKSRIIALLFTVALFIVPFVFAQTGKIHTSAPAPKKGVHTDGEVPISSYEVYLMGIGSTPNSAGMSMISCDNDDGGVTVGSDDGDVTCYAVAGSDGTFNLAGLYYGYTDGTGCTTGAAQAVYFEARKGVVGATSNPKLALMAIPPSLWTCDYMYNNSGSVFIDITDFTNAMAAFGLAPFANWNNPTTSDGISAAGSTGKAALLLAFDAINSVVPVSSGAYAGSDSNVQKQLDTIADVISPCIDSNGTGSGCTSLFSDSTDSNTGFNGSHSPANTWQGVASMGQDPNNSVSGLFSLITSTPPWLPNDTSAPSSWAVPVSGAPYISSLSAHSATKGSTHSITLYGSNLVDSTTGGCPTVAVGFQKAGVTSSTCYSGTGSITVTMPSSPGNGAIAVYVNGMVSNATYFNVMN